MWRGISRGDLTHRQNWRVRLPIFRVKVIGPSMEPTLTNGQIVWARRAGVRPGALAVFREPDRPALVSIKRIVRVSEEGVWMSGDAPEIARDSRHYGWVPHNFILGTVMKSR